MTIQKELEGVNSRLTELAEKLAPLIEANKRSIGDKGEGLDAVIEVLKAHGDEVSTLTERAAALTSAVADLQVSEKAAARPGPKRRRSLARQIVESKEIKGWLKSAGKQGVVIKVDGLFTKSNDVIDIDEVDASGLVTPEFIRPPVPLAQPTAIMRSLCTVLNTSATDRVKIGREEEVDKLITKLTAASTAPQTVFAVENTNGFGDSAPYSTITLDNGTTSEQLIIASIDAAAGTLTTTTASSIDLTVANGTIKGTKFTPTPAGLVAPRSRKVFADFNIPIVDLDTSMVVTLNQLNDIASLEDSLRTNLFSFLAEMEDVNFFYAAGDGVETMRGLYNDPTLIASTKLWSLQPSGTTVLDFILNAFYEIVQEDNYVPTTVLVSPDVHKLLIQTKASDGQYIFWTQAAEGGAPMQVFAMRLAWANTLQPQSCIVADFMRAFYIADRQSAEIEIGTVDSQLTMRQRTLLAVERVGFGVVRPEAARLLTVDSKP